MIFTVRNRLTSTSLQLGVDAIMNLSFSVVPMTTPPFLPSYSRLIPLTIADAM